jgi:hypothetical protein
MKLQQSYDWTGAVPRLCARRVLDLIDRETRIRVPWPIFHLFCGILPDVKIDLRCKDRIVCREGLS